MSSHAQLVRYSFSEADVNNQKQITLKKAARLNTIPNPNLYRNYYRVLGGFRQTLMYIGAVVPLCAVACFIWTGQSTPVTVRSGKLAMDDW